MLIRDLHIDTALDSFDLVIVWWLQITEPAV